MSTPNTRYRLDKGAAARVLAALSRARELTNAQVAEAAGCSESYSSRVLNFLARVKPLPMATPRRVKDGEDFQTVWTLWKRGPA